MSYSDNTGGGFVFRLSAGMAGPTARRPCHIGEAGFRGLLHP